MNMNKLEKFKINFHGGNGRWNISEEIIDENITIYSIAIEWEKNVEYAKIVWEIPMIDMPYIWSPLYGNHTTSLLPNWQYYQPTLISSGAPVVILYNGANVSKYSWAISECSNLVLIKSGVVEENGNISNVIKIPLKQYVNRNSLNFKLRIDKTECRLEKAVAAVTNWWENDIGLKPAYVPDDARKPAYSFWYSYHQMLTDKIIEDECRRAKELGFEVCIIDDGWQTDDVSRGYAFCGDWKVAETKIPDMAEHVKKVHDMGMKYVIWFAVPLIGEKSEHFNEFKDMLYEGECGGAYVLDPRYKKVREFLINVYKNALIKYDFDGFKLDFIDMWRYNENVAFNEKMDIPIISDAVDVLMTGIKNTLSDIKKDILIEFRQSYIGPHIKKYGNMFRVADCPNDYIRNRRESLNLRLLMGEQPVHSDMLMWNKDEKPEMAAVQIISVLFAVMQYSARLDNISEPMFKMSRFWLNFMKEHKKTLLSGELFVYEPHLNYTWAKAVKNNECITAVYSVSKCIEPDNVDVIYIANGCESDKVLCKLNGEYEAVIKDCYGQTVGTINLYFKNEICILDIPIGGAARLQKMDNL